MTMFNKHDGGKGDKPILPQDREKFDNNWDRIFKAKKTKEHSQCNGFCGVQECKETPKQNCSRTKQQYPCEVVRPTDNK